MKTISEWQVIHRADQAEAILHPIRQRILEILREPGSATSLGETLGISRQQVNYHLKTLESVGLVTHRGQTKKRNCFEQFFQSTARAYTIHSTAYESISLLSNDLDLTTPLSKAAKIGERLVGDVADLQSRAEGPVPALALDTVVQFANEQARSEFGREFRDVVNQLLAKYGSTEGPESENFRVVLAIHPKP